jgi:ribosomal protein L14E/L6E/L27E
MEITPGSIVLCLNGRDEGDLFFTLSVGDGYAELADGKKRPIEKAKHKKLKHVRFVEDYDCTVRSKLRSGEPITNNELKKALAVYSAGSSGDNGGM